MLIISVWIIFNFIRLLEKDTRIVSEGAYFEKYFKKSLEIDPTSSGRGVKFSEQMSICLLVKTIDFKNVMIKLISF